MKTGIHEGEYRTQKYECIAGIDKREAIYKENNVTLVLDVEKVYFSPRLSTERKRIYQQVVPGETILVMFSGCSPYPIVISKNTMAIRNGQTGQCNTKDLLCQYKAILNIYMNTGMNQTLVN